MIVLKNIKKTSTDISATYYVDGKGDGGFLRLRLADGEILEHKMPQISYGWSHALKELKRLGRRENLPIEKTVLWY